MSAPGTRPPARQGFTEYTPTPAGLAYAAEVRVIAPIRAVTFLDKIVQWAQGLSFSALVRAIYATYPEYRENSVFQG